MSSRRMLGSWKRLLRFRLRSLLVLVTFAAVLLGWWSDRLRMEEQLRRRDDLLSVLRFTRRHPPIDWAPGSTRPPGRVLWFNSHREFLTAVRDGKPWLKIDGERPTLFFGSMKIEHDTIPDLARLLKDVDVNVRLKAAYALRAIGHLSPAIAPQLMAVVADEPDVRCEAIWALQEIDGVLDRIDLLLTPYLDGNRPDELKAIVSAIHKHDPSYDLNPQLLELLTHPIPESRITAAEGLSIGPDTRPEVITRLLGMLADPDVKCRRVAAGRLGHARPSGELLHRMSQAFKKEPESDVRLALACAVERIHRRLSP